MRIHDVAHGGATVLRDNDSFGFAYLDYDRDYARFAAVAPRRWPERAAATPLSSRGWTPPRHPHDYLAADQLQQLFTRPQLGHREGSVPKLAFGRAERDGARLWCRFPSRCTTR